jgi:hypothetical protein
MSDCSDPLEAGSDDSLLRRFQETFAVVDMRKFGECLGQFSEVVASGDPGNALLLELLNSLDRVLYFNMAIIEKWIDEQPEIAAALARTGELVSRLLSDAEPG